MADTDSQKKLRTRVFQRNLLQLASIVVLAGFSFNVLTYCGSWGCKIKGYPTLSQIADRNDNLNMRNRRILSAAQQALQCIVAVGLVYAISLINTRIQEVNGTPIPMWLALACSSTLLIVTLVANNHDSMVHMAGFALFLLLALYVGWLVYRTLRREGAILSLCLLSIAVFLTVVLVINMNNGWSKITNPTQRSVIAGLEYAVVVVMFLAVCRLVN